jgi:tetratricopeptide (TPR) repeat protein
MLKQVLPLLIFLFLVSAATAQRNEKAAAYLQSGIEFKNKSMPTEAMLAFKKAVAIDKSYDSAYVEMGIINVRTTNLDSAILNVKKALAISPMMVYGWTTLGYIYRDSRPNYDSAIICYSNALKTDSLNKADWYSLAWCYNAKKEYDKAIPFAAKALEIDNTYRPAYAELGHAYSKNMKYAEGIEQFKKNLAVSVVDLPLFYLGMCYAQLKDKENALKEYEELKKINERLAASLKKVIDKLQ